jgi:hypothetical protein
MRFLLNKKVLLATGVLLLALIVGTSLIGHRKIEYITDVKPIINKNCITCHGGVRRKSGFSLLFRADALAKNESGKPAIIPGDPEHSEMIRRLTLKDPEERMPYKHPPLSAEDIDILRQWIKEGAQWGDHWAYLPVKQVEVPTAKSGFLGWFSPRKPIWEKNEIDYFIHDKLREEDLEPSPEADKRTILRRLSLDLTGVPAPTSLSAKFLADTSQRAYEQLVDSLLASPQYGERWTAMWLDLARYADTKGYERDDSRSIWRYRDWLIKAFNEDLPYDQFLTLQLAGDLVPNPDDEEFIASAFHRNTMTNDEGGTDNEEFRTAAVIDRVNTTWEGLMGTTFSCVQCHSHPYDPFRHEEYYKFMAFFNNMRDEDSFADYPLLREYNKEDSIKLQKLKSWLSHHTIKERADEIARFVKTWEPAINSLLADQFTNSELADTKWLIFRNHASCRLKNVDLENRNELIFRYVSWLADGNWTIHLDKPDGPVLKSMVAANTKGAWKIATLDIPKADGVHDLWFSYTNPHLKKPGDNGMQFDWFYFTQPFPGKGKPGYDSAYKYFWDLINSEKVVTTPIAMDNPNDMFRKTHVFDRGNWLVKGEEVQPDVPHSLNPFPKNAPRNRLGLAEWMTSAENPLTSRTIVNRIWEQLFGQGIAETLEDLGTQGIPPTHRELLDWLSWRLMHDYHWSLKKLLKEIVLSATYRQDSKVAVKVLEKDPFNKFYARGPRARLSGEQIRDQALAVSGLLSRKMFGPSVMPYQPGGIWLSPWNGATWEKSTGEDQYRRAIYTYWKRTAPYPSMMNFDGAAREVCTARRIRTNTPLQALVTLNDSVYIEASRYFAYRMQREGGLEVKNQISRGYELAMYQPIAPQKLAVLQNLYEKALQKFKSDKSGTCEMVGVDNEHNKPETAALVVVANAMLNLDEFVTKN